MKKALYSIFAAIFLMAALCICASAEVRSEDFNVGRLTDEKRSTYTEGQGEITLQSAEGIAHLYIEFDRLPGEWSILAGGKEYPVADGFLHQYVDIASLCGKQKTLTLRFTRSTSIADLYTFGAEEQLPDFVQTWNAPCNKADLMLISSHSDDEQLFFAGLLPYYAIERELKVQVVYIVQHFEANGVEDHTRPHEQLDGLWAVGVRNYPVMSDFPDVYSESKDKDTAFAMAEKAFGAAGVTFDDFKGYITECLRRFKPLVVVSHDPNGEYGHGTHVFCTAALQEALTLAVDDSQYPASAQKYGTWRPEKTYLHLYEQNQITMDWDTPYESLGGKTPFQRTQEGFGCHKSQHWTWFKRWIYGNNGEITKASQIKTYSPCQYGLYDTIVGPDEVGGDFMENVATYAQREAAFKADEEARLEQEAKKAAAEAARLQKEKTRKVLLWVCLGAGVLLPTVAVIIRKKRGH